MTSTETNCAVCGDRMVGWSMALDDFADLICPLCDKGHIRRYEDATPGQRERYWFGKCCNCGLNPDVDKPKAKV
jgi:hypothetical protein